MFAAGGVRPGIPRLRARLRGGWRSSTRRRRWRRLGALPGNRLKMLRGARKGSTRSGSTGNGASASPGPANSGQQTSRSWTTARRRPSPCSSAPCIPERFSRRSWRSWACRLPSSRARSTCRPPCRADHRRQAVRERRHRFAIRALVRRRGPVLAEPPDPVRPRLRRAERRRSWCRTCPQQHAPNPTPAPAARIAPTAARSGALATRCHGTQHPAWNPGRFAR